MQSKRPRIDSADVFAAASSAEDVLAALERDESQAVIVDEAAVKRIVMQVKFRLH